MSPDIVVAAARAWIGTPYHHQARLKGVGVDCAGLIIGVARELEMIRPDEDVVGYGRSPDGRSLIEYCAGFMERAPALSIGTVAVLTFPRTHSRVASHMGIVGQHPHGLSLIHADGTVGRVVEQRMDEQTLSRIVAVFAMPGVA